MDLPLRCLGSDFIFVKLSSRRGLLVIAAGIFSACHDGGILSCRARSRHDRAIDDAQADPAHAAGSVDRVAVVSRPCGSTDGWKVPTLLRMCWRARRRPRRRVIAPVGSGRSGRRAAAREIDRR
jgi:hypothetical protein